MEKLKISLEYVAHYVFYFHVCTQQTTGTTALHDLSTTPGSITSASSSVELTDILTETEQSPSQDEFSPLASSVSPAATQPLLDTEPTEKTDLPPESGKYV